MTKRTEQPSDTRRIDLIAVRGRRWWRSWRPLLASTLILPGLLPAFGAGLVPSIRPGIADGTVDRIPPAESVVVTRASVLDLTGTAEPQGAAVAVGSLATPGDPAVEDAGHWQDSGHWIEMEVTAYCPCTRCCGPNAQGLTASGRPVSYNNGRFVAADTRLLPFRTELVIPGYAGDTAVEVIDRGGAIKGNKLDVYFDSHEEALRWGRQHLRVRVTSKPMAVATNAR